MRRLLLCVGPLVGLAACSRDAPEPPPPQSAPAAVETTAAQDGSASLSVPYPSLQHYPPLDAALEAALSGTDPVARLRGLARTFGPHRPPYEQWDRTGHIRIAGEFAGFASKRDGKLVPQPPPAYNLSCAGGFLEGVRVLLLPTVELDALDACAPEEFTAVQGAPVVCDNAGEFGVRALVNIALRLPAEQLADGKSLNRTAVRTSSDLPDIAPGRAMFCTVSHVSPSAGGERFHHHMMVLLPPDEEARFGIFDTTGARGVSLRRRRAPALAKYIKHLLADNDTYRYEPNSAELTCLSVVL